MTEKVEETKEEIKLVSEGTVVHKFQTKVEYLRELFQTVNSCRDEILINLTDEGWIMKQVDISHVMMMGVEVPINAFQKYNLKEKDIKIGIEVDKIHRFLKLCTEYNKVWIEGRVLTTKNPNEHNLKLTVDNGLTRLFRGADIAGIWNGKVPNLNEAPLKAIVKTKDLKFGLESTASISDQISLVYEDKTLKLETEGNMERLYFLLNIDIDCGEKPFYSLFPHDYLWQFVRHIPSEEIEINLGDNYPLVMNFTVAEGKIPIKMILAPKIESD